jgi:hypothetical protein
MGGVRGKMKRKDSVMTKVGRTKGRRTWYIRDWIDSRIQDEGW